MNIVTVVPEMHELTEREQAIAAISAGNPSRTIRKLHYENLDGIVSCYCMFGDDSAVVYDYSSTFSFVFGLEIGKEK